MILLYWFGCSSLLYIYIYMYIYIYHTTVHGEEGLYPPLTYSHSLVYSHSWNMFLLDYDTAFDMAFYGVEMWRRRRSIASRMTNADNNNQLQNSIQNRRYFVLQMGGGFVIWYWNIRPKKVVETTMTALPLWAIVHGAISKRLLLWMYCVIVVVVRLCDARLVVL